MKRSVTVLLFVILFGFPGRAPAQNYGQMNIQAPEATGMQVNAITGALVYQRQDIFIPDIGFDLELTSTYSSSEGWRYSFEWDAEMNDNEQTADCTICSPRKFPTGNIARAEKTTVGVTYFISLCRRKLKITKNDWGTIQFLMPDELHESDCSRTLNYNVLVPAQPSSLGSAIESESGFITYTTRFGDTYSFSSTRPGPGPKGKILNIEDRNGNQLVYEYEGDELRRLVAPSGRYLEFTWQEYVLGWQKLKRLTKVTDPNGNTPREFNYEYDESARLVKVVNPMGGETQYVYAAGKLNRVIDENGNETVVSYAGLSGEPRVSAITTCLSKMTLSYTISATYLKEFKNSGEFVETTYRHNRDVITEVTGNCCGYQMEYAYDPETKDVTGYIDANGYVTNLEYDTLGNLTKMTDPLGCTTEMAYEPEFSQMTSYKDKKGHITTFQYDQYGNLTDISRPLGIAESYQYDNQGKITQFTDGRGHTTTYDYNSNGDLVRMNHPLGYSTEMTYDGRSNKLTETDANGHAAAYEYDDLNRLIRTTNALNGITAVTYDNRGNATRVTNPKNQSTAFEYDQLDRLTAIKAPMDLNYRFGYDGLDNLVRVMDLRGATTTYVYNHLNLVESIQDQLGFETFFTYDGSGNRTSTIDPNGNTTHYEYDALNRLERMIDPLGHQSLYEYDCNDNLTTVTDANGNVVSLAYDNLDRTVSHTDALGAVSQFEYDQNDNLTKITDAKNNETAYTYDALDRNTAMTFADNTTRVYTYDGVGNVAGRTDNNGHTTNYTYDELNRLTLRDYPDANDDIFQYDPLGNILLAQNQNATVEFTYDDANRMTAETLNGKSTRYAYNTQHGKMTLIYPSGKVVEEIYDLRGQLTDIKENGNFLANFQYDDAGRLLGRTYANGTSTAYAYNTNNWLTSITHNPAEFIKLIYTHDNVGNILTQEFAHRSDHSEAYAYDANYRLTNYKKGALLGGEIAAPTKEIAYAYDALGNRTNVVEDGVTTTYVSNEMNEYMGLSGGQNVSFGYDDNGNLLMDGNASYAYDHANRLVSIADNGNNIALGYDPFSRRIQEVSEMESIDFYYSRFQSIEERGAGDKVNRNLFYGTWIDDLVSVSLSDTDYFMHANQIGSISGLTDQAGDANEYYEYDPFGEVEYYDSGFDLTSQSEVSKNFFAGRYKYLTTPNTNLYYNRLRHYSNWIGRFIQRDPLEYFDGYNQYMYVLNDPIKYIDPSGLKLEFGCKEAEKEFADDIKKILKTKKGKELLRLLEKSKTKFRIIIGPAYRYDEEGKLTRLRAARYKTEIIIDPNYHPIFRTDQGLKRFSTTRILAHELGHLAGTPDKGSGSSMMNNIDTWENPIMSEIENFNRTDYYFPPQECGPTQCVLKQ